MKRIILLSCACLLSIFSFSETEHSLKKYFKDNILKLDPIEGAYSVSMRQWVTPSAGEGSIIDGTTTWYIKKNYNGFEIYNQDGLYLKQFNIKRIGDTNAYLFNFNDYVYGYESHQFVLQNDVMFEFTHEFTPSTVKRQINNTYGIPLNRIHSYHKMRAIKSYPTSSMYLEAARKEAEQAEKELQEAIEQAQRKAGWSGSGFALAQGHIVTNYHVVENAKTILVKGIKGDFVTEYRASVVATDKVNDIAIIKISDDRFKGFGAAPYKIKRAMSDVGESVWALGYPMVGVMGDEVKFTDGKISARTGIQGDMSVYQISVPIQPGNSGGPLFDNNGNIVGITSSGLNREAFNSENVNYAIKTSYLYNLIESSMSTSILPQGTAMQGQSLTEKIKLAKKFVYIILCSEDPNFHNEILPAQNKEAKNATIKVLPPSNTNGKSPTSKSGNGEKDKNTTEKGEVIQTAPITQKSKPTIELDKHSHDFGSFLECDGPVETSFRITNTGESQLVLYTVSPSSEGVTAVPSDRFIAAGKSGVINVTYHPELRPGKFTKTITIKSNASDSVAQIYIKGEVIGRKIIRIDEKGDSTMVLGGSMYPKFGGKLAISKITLTPDFTILDCSFTSGSLSIDKKTYLKTSHGRKYKLKSVKNIPLYPDVKEIPSGGKASFSLYFEQLPQETEKFDFIEDSKAGWKIYGIQLK